MPAGNAPAQGTSNIIPVSLKTGITAPIIRIGQGMDILVFTTKPEKCGPLLRTVTPKPSVLYGIRKAAC